MNDAPDKPDLAQGAEKDDTGTLDHTVSRVMDRVAETAPMVPLVIAGLIGYLEASGIIREAILERLDVLALVRVGEGGMATVYLAEDLKHERPNAGGAS